jgi:hypothetical protein
MLRRIEYSPEPGKPLWKVELFGPLSEEFNISECQMPAFHTIAARHPKSWRVLRMLYGINPVLVPTDTDADYLKIWSRADVCARLKIAMDEVQTSLDVLLAAWSKAKKTLESFPPVAEPPPPVKPKKPTSTPVSKPPSPKAPTLPAAKAVVPVAPLVPSLLPPMSPEERETLDKYGFTQSIFEVDGREVSEAVAERTWFTQRLVEIQQLMDEPAVNSLARGSLMNELYLRRLDTKLATLGIDEKQFKTISETKERVAKEYREAWEQIKGIVPWANQVAHKHQFVGVFSDILEGYLRFKSDPKNNPLDGVFTALELQILMRESQQAEVRYRPGQVAAILESFQGLTDPNWQRTLPNGLLKQMDVGFREAARRVREETGIEVADLESDDPAKGEYPPLYIPKEEIHEEPAQNIPLS